VQSGQARHRDAIVTGLRFAPTKITWDFFDISRPSEMKPYICSIVCSRLRPRRATTAVVASRVEVSTTVVNPSVLARRVRLPLSIPVRTAAAVGPSVTGT
jgi:hypothetical protein